WIIADADGGSLRDESGRQHGARGAGAPVAANDGAGEPMAGASADVADAGGGRRESIGIEEHADEQCARGELADGRGAGGRRDRAADDMADADESRLQGRLGGELPQRAGEWLARPGGAPILDPRRLAEFAARNSWWLVEPDVCRDIDGFPDWLDRYVERGLSHAESESRRKSKILRDVWSPHVSQALRRTVGGLDRFQQAQILFAFVREYENGIGEARLLVAGKEESKSFLRSLREREQARGASHRSRSQQQRSGKYSDALLPLSYDLALDGEAPWAGNSWQDAVPATATGVIGRVDRFKALGNAVVPQIPELIGRAILAACFPQPRA